MTSELSGTTAGLVERARQGDSAALQILLRRYLPRLQHWASRRLPNYARDLLDTDDLVQDAVLNTIKRLDAFEPRAPGSFLAYLRRAILNRIGDEIRRAQRKEMKAEFFREGYQPQPSPLEEAIGSETIERYERALGELEPDAQEAVIARIELGFSYAEIAESIGKPSADAVRMMVGRAIRRLAESMQDVRDEDEDVIRRLVDAVSNREDIDWDESEKASASSEERAFIHSLRILRGIADHGAPLSRIELAPGRPAGADDPSALPKETPRTTWGHLVLLERVGHGSYGEVYRAWDPKLSTDVALKLIPCPFASTEEALREGRMLARVYHPNVARVFGADRIGETVGVWMEYIDGLTLKDIARDEAPLLPGMLLPIANRLLEALTAIHEAKIVHRDLKPENVLIDKMGRVVVTDFGCGAFRTEADAGRRAQFAGTPRFMAPELFAKEEPTPSSDLYALGVILFHLATGKYPVEATSVAELQAAHRSGRREFLGSLRPDLPRAFVDSVDKTLDPDPRRRHRSAKDWLDSITRPPETAAPPKLETAPRRPVRSHVTIAAAALAALAVGAWAMFATMNAPLRFDAQMLRSRDNGAWTKLDNAAIASSDAVRVGDRLMLAFDSDRKTYVYVINWDDEGRAYLLFPMRSSELHNPLAAGDEHHLPGTVQGEPFAWEVSSAGGREHFAIVASRDRLAEFERLVGALESVAVDAQKELSASAFDGLLRGVGRATSSKGKSADNPEEILRSLEKQIQSDREMKRRVAMRVITVQSARG